ncbi:MAG: hypothetical protein R3Y51_01050 [Rikenellaceae bacterium]
MEGKIFNESSNIYQDQAKILFNYYKTAAEKIVSQEIVIEEQVAQCEADILALDANKKQQSTQQIIGFVVAGLGFVVGGLGIAFDWVHPALLIIPVVALIFAIVKITKIKQIDASTLANQQKIDELGESYDNIFRDYKVSKLGVAYVPVASRVAFSDKSFLVDHTGSTINEKFTLQILRQNQLINSSINELRNLTQEAPIIEPSENVEKIETGNYSRSIQSVNFNDYFGKLDRTLRTISYCLNDKDETTVELPVIFPESPYVKFLSDYATTNVADKPVFKVFDTHQHDDQINGFKELNETRKSISSDTEEVDLTLRHLMVDMAASVQTTSKMKVTSVSTMIDYSNKLMFNILKAPYNFYSPMLEAEEIDRIKGETFNYGEFDIDYKPFDLRESSKMRFDLISMCWVDESGAKTTVPFGVNQIQSEIMAPMVTNLLKETYKDRLQIYNHIKDQKIDYLNQWHRDTQDFFGRNRAEASDLINLMRANFTDYTAAYNTLAAFQKTEENMRKNATLESTVTESQDNSAEVLVAYQQQSEQFRMTQDEFADYMERLSEDIDFKAAKFGHVEYYDASLRDKKSRDTAIAADNVSSLDDRRKPLAEVNPLLAQISDLPPAPSVEDIAYEHVGVNLMSLAQSAIEDLDSVAYKHVSDEDYEDDDYENDEEYEDFDDEDDFDDEEVTTIDVEENDEVTTIDVEEDDEDDEDLNDEDQGLVVGMEAFALDEDGNKVYYDDGEYADNDNNAVIVIRDGKVAEIRQGDNESNQ